MGLLIDITALVFSLLIMLLSDSKEVLFLASLLAFIKQSKIALSVASEPIDFLPLYEASLQ